MRSSRATPWYSFAYFLNNAAVCTTAPATRSAKFQLSGDFPRGFPRGFPSAFPELHPGPFWAGCLGQPPMESLNRPGRRQGSPWKSPEKFARPSGSQRFVVRGAAGPVSPPYHLALFLRIVQGCVGLSSNDLIYFYFVENIVLTTDFDYAPLHLHYHLGILDTSHHLVF